MLEYLTGAVTALVSVTLGAIIQMHWLNRRLLPPPTKPTRPNLTLVEKNGGNGQA